MIWRMFGGHDTSRRVRVLGIALLILAGSARPASGAEVKPRDITSDRGPVSVLLHIGTFAGFGGGLALGTRDVGIRGSAGWFPLLVASNSHLDFYSGFQTGADLYARFFSPGPAASLGGLAGYRYNTLLGHGITVGGYVQVALNRAFDVNVFAGFLFFPDGEDHLRREEQLPAGSQFAFPGPKVNFGVSAGIAFFP
jgi:hypothetical protein